MIDTGLGEVPPQIKLYSQCTRCPISVTDSRRITGALIKNALDNLKSGDDPKCCAKVTALRDELIQLFDILKSEINNIDIVDPNRLLPKNCPEGTWAYRNSGAWICTNPLTVTSAPDGNSFSFTSTSTSLTIDTHISGPSVLVDELGDGHFEPIDVTDFGPLISNSYLSNLGDVCLTTSQPPARSILVFDGTCWNNEILADDCCTYLSGETSQNTWDISHSIPVPAGTCYSDYLYWNPTPGAWCNGNSTGSLNVHLGCDAAKVTPGAEIIAIGRDAGTSNSQNNSISIGTLAGTSNAAIRSVNIGLDAGRANGVVGEKDTVAIGTNAGELNQQSSSIAIGLEAGRVGLTEDSIAIGGYAAHNDVGLSSIAIGTYAGFEFMGAAAIAIGNHAANSSQGDASIAIGVSAGKTSQGGYAVALGNSAGYNAQVQGSVAIGSSAGYNSQGTLTVALGASAGRLNQHQYSTALGAYAGLEDLPDSSIAIGLSAGYDASIHNDVSGFYTGFCNSYSPDADRSIINKSSLISNDNYWALYLNHSNGEIVRTATPGFQGLSPGTIGVPPGTDLDVLNCIGGSWTATTSQHSVEAYFDSTVTASAFVDISDKKLKKDIKEITLAETNSLYALNPVTFKWRASTDKNKHYGFIAQEVEEVYPTMVKQDKYYKGLSYNEIIPILVKEVQSLRKELMNLKHKVDRYEGTTNDTKRQRRTT